MTAAASDDLTRPWETLVHIQREQVTQLTQQTALLTHILRAQEEQDAGREKSVEEVKKHITETVKGELGKSELWWRRAFWIAVGLVALSNLVGVGLDRAVALLKGG